MTDMPQVGRIAWIDMTTADAGGLRDFYSKVVGWRSQDVGMGDYADYAMVPPHGDDAVAGICHALGENADLPTGWLIYIVVADVAASAAASVEQGGEIVVAPRSLGGGRFCVIRDPAGQVAALYQP